MPSVSALRPACARSNLSKTGRESRERLEFVANESGKYRREAGQGARQAPLAEAALHDSKLGPGRAVRLRGPGRGAAPGKRTFPGVGHAFPVGPRRCGPGMEGPGLPCWPFYSPA